MSDFPVQARFVVVAGRVVRLPICNLQLTLDIAAQFKQYLARMAVSIDQPDDQQRPAEAGNSD